MRYNLFRCILPLTCLFVAGNLHAKPKKLIEPVTAAAIDKLCETTSTGETALTDDEYVLQKNELLIDKGNQPSATTTNISRIIVCRINLFRYNATLTQQKGVVASQALPANILGPAIAATPATSAKGAKPPSGGGPYEVWADKVYDANAKAITFADAQSNVALRLACYTAITNTYSAVLLTHEEMEKLLIDLNRSTFCPNSFPAEVWTPESERNLAADLSKVEKLESDLKGKALVEFSAWLKQNVKEPDEQASKRTRFESLIAQNTATKTRILEALANSPDAAAVTAYNASVATAAMWDKRAAFTLAATDEWNQTVTLHCGIEYFGRTESQTVTLTATDFAQPAPVAVTPPFTFTNACLPSLTVSTGLAFSAVRNSTFAFEPGPGTATNATTTQVIGYATDNRITPLFVGQLNYAYLPHERAVQLHVSGGAGVGTSSGGTSGDFFLGNAFSFAHRAVFITPAFQLTSRTRLRDGYKIGDPMGALSSVPTISGWQSGFMVTVTFAVLH